LNSHQTRHQVDLFAWINCCVERLGGILIIDAQNRLKHLFFMNSLYISGHEQLINDILPFQSLHYLSVHRTFN